jgi:chemotaxis protein methyltransferase CheR
MSGTLRQREDRPVAGGEFAFSWADFRKIAALVHAESGIVLAEGKANLVYSRLAKRLRAVGLDSFRDYCALVSSEDGADERQAMIAAMTTNVTRFFREEHHFAYLKSSVLPGLAAKARRGGRVRIWSSACSSGEEPYSIALTVLSAMEDAAERDVLILASDLDPNMVARARAGVYGGRQLDNVPPEMRGKWFERRKSGDVIEYALGDAPRGLIRFRELNLLDPWPMKGRFDVIFCRNVMIYFDEETQNRIWARFAQLLEPGGLLCIGHSERIPASMPFDLVAQTTYRLRVGAPS